MRKRKGMANWDTLELLPPGRKRLSKICSIEGCVRPKRQAGLCTGHHRRREQGVPDWQDW